MPPRNSNYTSHGQFAGRVPPERQQALEPAAAPAAKAPQAPYRWNFPPTPTAAGSQNIQQVNNSTNHQFQWSRSAAMQPPQAPANTAQPQNQSTTPPAPNNTQNRVQNPTTPQNATGHGARQRNEPMGQERFRPASNAAQSIPVYAQQSQQSGPPTRSNPRMRQRQAPQTPVQTVQASNQNRSGNRPAQPPQNAHPMQGNYPPFAARNRPMGPPQNQFHRGQGFQPPNRTGQARGTQQQNTGMPPAPQQPRQSPRGQNNQRQAPRSPLDDFLGQFMHGRGRQQTPFTQEKEPSAAPDSSPLEHILDSLLKDDERTLIIILLLILIQEEADHALIFAMLYLLL